VYSWQRIAYARLLQIITISPVRYYGVIFPYNYILLVSSIKLFFK